MTNSASPPATDPVYSIHQPIDLYLELLKKSLLRYAMAERVFLPQQIPGRRGHIAQVIRHIARLVLKRRDLQFAYEIPFSAESRDVGRDWPSTAETMIGLRRLENVQYCVQHVIEKQIPGDLIETGVWRGGATIFMRGMLRALGVTNRNVWVADSFQGLPPPDAANYPADIGDSHWSKEELAVSLKVVQDNFRRYGLLDDQVKFLVGWFRDTLPTCSAKEFAVVRLDGDMYESTMDGLRSLYPKLSEGGYIIVDDYRAVPSCKQAVEDYRREFKLSDPLEPVDWTAVFWQKRGG
jgi:O-methyltransferase